MNLRVPQFLMLTQIAAAAEVHTNSTNNKTRVRVVHATSGPKMLELTRLIRKAASMRNCGE